MGVVGPGVPGWVDLGTPDLEGSKTFYGELFGWEADSKPDPRYQGYTTFTRNGLAAAGVAPLMMEGQPIAWLSYVIVDDAVATAAKVGPAGGTVLVAPMEVPDQGTMGVFLDPSGAAIGIWQPGKMRGAEIFNEPGALSWNELATRDVDAAKAFYQAVFDWGADDSPYGDTTYTQFTTGGRSVAGMMPMGDLMPAEVPPHWGVYFAVADCDETIATAIRTGGSVTMGPIDIPMGRIAGLVDPQGASFSVIGPSS